MATEFVLQTLREKGGEEQKEPLSETLKELFRRFFPGKEFEGVKTNEKGELEFAVTVGDGKKHDINDLSSGEKEILFGYLRLRNSAQRQSIILLDEPELHLNPKLIQGLPQFLPEAYRRSAQQPDLDCDAFRCILERGNRKRGHAGVPHEGGQQGGGRQ